MFNTHLYLCKIVWWDTEDIRERVDYMLCNAHSYVSCVEELTDYYQDDIVSMEITALEDGPQLVSKDIADAFLDGVADELKIY